ncbi:putative RNA helicase [Medicago truncatula]|uniref:Putative RNA helicase n=1 Tax=Medicago truncatula TaxID=3880 RepID=A0A396IA83_MEDTR|nr:putative RNA helicase [Medicago truncatula]
MSFSDLGLSEWTVQNCKKLGMQTPRRVQQHCIPKVLEGRDVVGIDETGSGKTAAFALPILQRLAEHPKPFGVYVFALVLTPTRELAIQLADQFLALGSSLLPSLTVVFLVLDEADQLLDVGFRDELNVIVQCLPENRQNLFFSETMTSNLKKMMYDRYRDNMYAFEACEGLKLLEHLKIDQSPTVELCEMDSKPGSRTWISPITTSYCNTTDCDNAGNDKHMSFSDLGLSEWMVRGCDKLGMQSPRPVQRHCIPKVLEGRHVIGIDKTGSGKTAAFALPILQRLGETPFGVFALVLTPTRELAVQLAHQFWILGSSLRLILTVVVGGLDKRIQAKQLVARPNLVIATPERLKILLQDNPEIAPIFAATKFLVLDEADQLLDVGFQEELKVIFQCLPENRQNLFFSATMTSNLQKMCDCY